MQLTLLLTGRASQASGPTPTSLPPSTSPPHPLLPMQFAYKGGLSRADLMEHTPLGVFQQCHPNPGCEATDCLGLPSDQASIIDYGCWGTFGLLPLCFSGGGDGRDRGGELGTGKRPSCFLGALTPAILYYLSTSHRL